MCQPPRLRQPCDPSGRSQPILGPQAINALKFAEVAGDHHEAPAAGMAGDEDVESSDELSASLEIGVNLPGMSCGTLVDREDHETGRQSFHGTTILGWSR